MMKNEVVAIVVTYNRKVLLRKCLNALLNQKNAECDIIVIDNASTDGTQEMLMEKFKVENVINIRMQDDLGSGGGFYNGIVEAYKRSYKYIWTMDDDAIPDTNALEAFLHADKELKGEWGFLTGAVYWTDGNYCGTNIPKTNIFKHLDCDELKENLVSIKMASYVSLFFKSEVLDIIKLPVQEYFMWTDDYEFTGRISREFPCYYVANSKVIHHMKINSRPHLADESKERIERHYFLHRNDVHCYRQYGVLGYIYILSKNMYTTFQVILHSKTDKGKKINLIWNGFKDGVRFHPIYKTAREEITNG